MGKTAEMYDGEASQYGPTDTPIDDSNRTRIETAYRRGFCQGVCAAMEGIEGGRHVLQLRKWYRRLLTWRWKKHKGRMTDPEWIARK